MSAGMPPICTAMTALVWGVTAASTASASRQSVSGLISAKTGMALTAMTAEAVAMKVYGGTMTSSPQPTSRARRASSREMVPLQFGTQNAAPQTFLNSS